jgi:(1->4)-alpha-D-glucan 1-alpha-D-glucosylmutase
VTEVEGFVARLQQPARVTSLAMTLLRLTSPGVPDTYQGTELWQLDLVDPDNRRPVDYARRRELLASLERSLPLPPLGSDDAGLAKLFTLRLALGLRHRRPELFDARGAYRALAVRGARADHVVAFARGAEPGAVSVTPRLVIGLGGDWADTAVTLPSGSWINLMDGGRHRGDAALAEVLRRFPVALLERE